MSRHIIVRMGVSWTKVQDSALVYIKLELPQCGKVSNLMQVFLELLSGMRGLSCTEQLTTIIKSLTDDQSWSGMSLTYSRNSSGPRTDPCSTPLVTADLSDSAPSTRTC